MLHIGVDEPDFGDELVKGCRPAQIHGDIPVFLQHIGFHRLDDVVTSRKGIGNNGHGVLQYFNFLPCRPGTFYGQVEVRGGDQADRHNRCQSGVAKKQASGQKPRRKSRSHHQDESFQRGAGLLE